MDWSKIKTIFIISFLILDLYLVYEFFKIWDESQYEVVKPEVEESIEKRLKVDEIEYVTLPKSFVEDYYLKAKPKEFKEEDLVDNSTLKNQTTKVTAGTILESELNEPLKVSDKFGPSELNSFIKNHILYGDEYRYWEESNDDKMIIYTQHFEGKTLFENDNGKLIFYLNDNNEIESYRQTYLEEIVKLSKSEKIIQPIKAIETLYSNDFIKPKSSITEVELGYYTLVDESAQVLNPAWCFVVDGKEKLFVSAFEGKIVELKEKEKEKDKSIVE
ncbi:two-component system regulatory protein YycI [Bacillus tuaregi]|uniref:two-component system regulatory protein YycI n=1 Tax=Bacillus tuaregi TaxID=1816695 RepID=UPI0008F8EAA4|nr:two-component system regulatory protein YycI [Bacillus tuaregi]